MGVIESAPFQKRGPRGRADDRREAPAPSPNHHTRARSHDADRPAIETTARLTASRRRFLRGLGAAVALPALESMLPRGINSAVAAAARGWGDRDRRPAPDGVPLLPQRGQPDTWWPEARGRTSS
jgi:hypothetical protein